MASRAPAAESAVTVVDGLVELAVDDDDRDAASVSGVMSVCDAVR